jgi:hypothetical protein
MHGPTWTFRANLTPFSLQSAVVVAASGAGAVTVLNATVWLALDVKVILTPPCIFH